MILCCGEALIDMIPAETAGGETAFVPFCGGAVFNTAIALGRLGTAAGLFTGLSDDLFGRQLQEALRESHVDASRSVISASPATLAFVQFADGHARYVFYDENTAGARLSPADLPDLPGSVETLFFGGISLCNAPAADAYLALAAREAGRRTIMLDPNVRPGFARDEPAYRARLKRMIALAGIIKVSDDDLHWIYPGPESLEDKIARALAAGPGTLLLTRGSDGASAHRHGQPAVAVPAVPARVADTVGAGDTFNAGFMARAAELGLLRAAAAATITDAALADCLGFAARAAAVTVSRPGANPPWRNELEEEQKPS